MNSEFWNKMAGGYDKSTEKRFSDANTKIVEASKKYCKSDMNLLDIGCGTGTFTIELAKHVKQIDAVDCSSKMLEIAQKKSDLENINNINWKCSDIITMLNSDKKYNMVTAFNILVYLQNPKEVLSNIYDMLEDGGYFLSVTDCPGDANAILKGAESLLSKMNLIPKMNFFKVNQLEELIKDAGFKIVFAENFHLGEPNYYIAARK